MINVFIDGHVGTTGLQIYDMCQKRQDINLFSLNSSERKNIKNREICLNEADFVFLCLPDTAAIEAVSLIKNINTKVIDASTAHRTNNDWVYGLAELSPKHRNAIAQTKRLANPGCHATGFISIMYPLIHNGLIDANFFANAFSLTGYSGGGKQMIAAYEDNNKDVALLSPRSYALNQSHKHLAEMKKITGLINNPCFIPVVDNFYKGMQVIVPLHTHMLAKKVTKEQIYQTLRYHYQNEIFITVKQVDEGCETFNNFIPSNYITNTNELHILVCGNDTNITLHALFDNLGKGASGAAMQNMNIMLGIDERAGL